MKKQFLAFILLALAIPTFAQKGSLTSKEESDPKAKAVLEQIRKRFQSYQSLAADFTLDITLPEQPMESQKGALAQQGSKYRVNIAGQEIISDGKAIWMILKQNKEVQIMDMPDEDEMGSSILSPESMLTFYDKGDFVYYLTNEYKDGSRTIQQIEFKPLDRNADYSKLRMNVNKANSDVISVEAFARDGSRYKLSIDKLTPNKAFPAGHFSFDKAKYPDYYVEDLRE
ncbi:MAG TPA: outer membrane lipoprotein carrier protein LolA [Saprospiraceae bacterium]|nr:outer membrane lipoprotein carrier protein LolA [Lewinellaceae bacterium]HQU61274.1 outer membrane lipoprotein carrier protein LolA [Saprospiraceae bacterium]